MSVRRKPDEGRYSKVSRRVWGSADFRELSAPKPNAQTLWFRLLTGPELGVIPGLFEWSEAGTAERLGWTVPALRKCLTEITVRGMAVFDKGAGVMWVPKGIRHNPPDNPNVVLGWKVAWREIPECPVKSVAQDALTLWCVERGQAWLTEWSKVLGDLWVECIERVGGNPFPAQPPQPSGNQEAGEVEGTRTGEVVAAATSPRDELFAMHPTWELQPDTRSQLEVELIPGWAIDAIVPAARTHYAADQSDRRRDSAWNQAVAKWVRGDWRDPRKRPRKPDFPEETTQTQVRTFADVLAARSKGAA